MNYKSTRTELYSRLDKSITELLEVLGEINEADASNAENEWSIDDNNGGRITLSLDRDSKDLTITKGRLKLILQTEG